MNISIEELIDIVDSIPELSLPNGATGAIWKNDLINALKEHYENNKI